MSKFVFVCSRHPNDPRLDRFIRNVSTIATQLAPNNIQPYSPRFVRGHGTSCCIINPTSSVHLDHDSFHLGLIVADERALWSKPGTPAPEGCYAIGRSDTDTVELLTDAGGTRTIWYAFDDEILMASSSQRALVMLLGSFQPNPMASLWMLSSGTLGPVDSWDDRLRSLPPDARLTLDRRKWTVDVCQLRPQFTVQVHDLDAARKALETVFDQTLRRMAIDTDQWCLPLSGGYDSRGLLAMLGPSPNLRTVTWGKRESLADPRNDASVAQSVAGHYGTKHKFFSTDLTADDLDSVFSRFVGVSEGRIDHIGGYLDGFALWRQLFESGVSGFIRGDEGFGWTPVGDLESARRSVGLTTCRDFRFLRAVVGRIFGVAPIQTLPREFDVEPGESIERYRDRLYHAFRFSAVLGALNEIKCAYVESCSPYLFRDVLRLARTFDDHLRTGKPVLKEIVRRICPRIPIATRAAIEAPRGLFRRPEIARYLRESVETDCPTGPQVGELINAVMRRARWAAIHRPLALASDVLINVYQRRLRRNEMVRYSLNDGVVMFRSYIICRSTRMLYRDATVLRAT